MVPTHGYHRKGALSMNRTSSACGFLRKRRRAAALHDDPSQEGNWPRRPAPLLGGVGGGFRMHGREVVVTSQEPSVYRIAPGFRKRR